MSDVRTVTTRPARLLLVPDHTFLAHNEGRDWNLARVKSKLADMLTGDSLHDLQLDLIFPGITLREVDHTSLLWMLSMFSAKNGVFVEFITHTCPNVHPELPAMPPQAFTTPIGSHNSPERRLTVNLVAKDVFDFNGAWRSALSTVGILPNLPVPGAPYADVVTLLESGYRRPKDLPYISMMVRGDHGQPWIRDFPATGSHE